MALDPLATIDDLTARGVTVEVSETTVVNTYLAVASTVVRDAAGVPISEVESTVTLEGEAGQWLSLPGAPVTAVSAVELDGETLTDWRLRSGALWRPCGWLSDCGPSEVTVTYSHGLTEVPEDIVDIVCRLAAIALVNFRSGANAEDLAAKPVVQERIGDYSVTYAYELTFSDMELPKYLRARLAARFGTSAASVRSR
ncbi:hypothetical protein [Streptomyces sp. SP17KL33]|uniref:hypothetical protein n=1 Tax=Streptomyces sp. SP17KL33 TaxID=3002534 RepID=UPI002E771073|nr:hypothetical protein [Streptomyces sp. SP17KL33]MEE1835757.1 hypothetical protein [Streptomyces sp. SP17KL33]